MKKRAFICILIVFGLSLFSQESPAGDGLILVEGGAFFMGSESGELYEYPVHNVQVSSFYISPYEVTQGLWKTIMNTGIDVQRAKLKPAGRLRGKGWGFPMYYVSWYEAVEFCNKLSELNGYDPCYSGSKENIVCDFTASGYRLPTEAEWEYAARGGNRSRDYTYAGSNTLDSVAWYNGNSAIKTQEVGRKVPNELGLYDMSGNVNEWCWDQFSRYTEKEQINPRGDEGLIYRVFRGGSWSHPAEYSRSTFRIAYEPDRRGNNLGFRMVRRP